MYRKDQESNDLNLESSLLKSAFQNNKTFTGKRFKSLIFFDLCIFFLLMYIFRTVAEFKP